MELRIENDPPVPGKAEAFIVLHAIYLPLSPLGGKDYFLHFSFLIFNRLPSILRCFLPGHSLLFDRALVAPFRLSFIKENTPASFRFSPLHSQQDAFLHPLLVGLTMCCRRDAGAVGDGQSPCGSGWNEFYPDLLSWEHPGRCRRHGSIPVSSEGTKFHVGFFEVSVLLKPRLRITPSFSRPSMLRVPRSTRSCPT
jgi:hypothetical protein